MPFGVVTSTSTVPGACPVVVQVRLVPAPLTLIGVQALPPTETLVALVRPMPVSVTAG